MNVSLPAELRGWVEARVADAGYATASEYVRQLIRDDQARQRRLEVDAKLLEGLESGDPISVTKQWWSARRAELQKFIESNKPE